MLKTIVKASDINNLTDARYFSAWEVQYLGFNLDPSSGHPLSYDEAGAIKEWLEGPKMVGEFGLTPAESILEVMDKQRLDAAQVNMMYPTEEIRKLKGLFLLQELVFEAETKASELEKQILAHSPYVNLFLIDFTKNGISWEELQEGKPETVRWIQSISDSIDLLIHISFPIPKLLELLKETGVKGISVKGGEEEKVGFKSFDDLDLIFEALSE
jgi:phosphoribosylanthranilate isomerase